MFRQQLLLGFLLLMLIGYVRQLAVSPTTGQDFKAFFAAAVVLAEGGDPYDWQALGRKEDALYNAPGHLAPGDPAYYDFMPLPEGPWLPIAMLPATHWGWPAAYAVFSLVMAATIAAGTWMVLTRLGWNRKRRTLALICVLLSPIAFINLFIGQITPLVFCAFAGAWTLSAIGRPVLGGLVLSLVWVKPNLGLALPVVVALLEPRSARRLLAGLGFGTVAALALAWTVLGSGLLHWPLELIQHWRALQGLQPDVASIHAFYYPALEGPLKTVVLVLTLLALAAYASWALRRLPDAQTRGMTVLLLWVLALPYVHSLDTLLLLPIAATLLRPALDGWADRWMELALWAFMLLPLCYFLGLRIGFFNGFSAIAVALLAVAWHNRMLRHPLPALEAVA